MNRFRLFVTLMIGGLCEAKIWEIPLPEHVQKCYDDRVKDEDTSIFVGSKLGWLCDNMITSQISQPMQWDAQTVSYYNHLLEGYISVNNTDGGAAVPRHKRQAGPRRCIRREYRMLSDQERTRFHNAVNTLKRDTTVRPNKYDAIAQFHLRGLRSAHNGEGFTGWHRGYLNMFETALQEVDPSVCVPYWDSRRDSDLPDPTRSNIWTPAFMGTPNGPVVNGPFANWRTPNGAPLIRNVGRDGELISATIVEDILSRRRYEEITSSSSRYNLELQHGGNHVYAGGAMSLLTTSSYDPIFFLLHCFIDLIFELFRDRLRVLGRNPERYPDAVPVNSPHHGSAPTGFGNQRQADLYRNSASETYEYQPVPTRCSASSQCGSRYFTCRVDIGRCVPITVATAVSSSPAATTTQRRMATLSLLSAPIPTQSPVVPEAQLLEGLLNDTMCLNSEKSFDQAIQNDFCSDHTCDTNEWVMIPVKIISVRPPKFNNYKSYPVHKGLIDSHDDIYSPRAYNQTNRYITRRLSNPKTYRRCGRDESVGEVLVSSRGINYQGFYKEAAIVDQRLAVSISLGFVAVKKPVGAKVSKALIRAHDSCGRVCQAACQDPITGYFKECKGAIAVSAEKPAMYGTSYDEAVMSVFDYEYNSHLPQFKSNNFFIAFYCDYQSKFPYTDYIPGGVPQPPVAVNPPAGVARPSNTET